ncbi:MAG: outer membrane beta-barrel protein [Bacteroidota bacterium]
MLRLTLIFIFAVLIVPVFAQTGIISGTVIDNRSKETIIGANVFIEGTTIGASTDLDGNFTIGSLKPGRYNVVVKYVSYKDQIIPDVEVGSGKRTTLAISLVEDVAELAEVVVTAVREISNDISLVKDIKGAKLVVTGISAEQIVKMPDRDAAQVMQRMAGVTIADNRFVLVRGLPERYNQVMINRIIGPSTEIDKRSFSFDLIPSGAIDQMLVFKSGSAENPGDFAGGVIQLVTKAPTSQSFTNVGLTFGFRGQSTFTDYMSSQGSPTDKFGFDNGFRSLPSGFPSSADLKGSSRISDLRMNAGRSLTNNFGNSIRQTPLDMGINVVTSNSFKIGSVVASNLTAIAYSNSYQNYNSRFLRYNEFDATSATKRFDYNDHYSTNDVRMNALHNWNFQLNDRNKIEFKNLFVQLGEDETIVRKGDDFIQRPTNDLVNYAYHYLSRTIYSGQLEGTHDLGENGTSKLKWVMGTNMINRNEPDYRRFRTFREKSTPNPESDPFTMQLPPNGNLFETGRFWSDLKDRGYSHGLTFERSNGKADQPDSKTLKAGYLVEYKTRSFNARYLNYLYPGLFDQAVGEQLRVLPLDQIFAPNNISKTDGFVIEEGTTNQDSYKGSNLLTSAFVSSAFPIGKFNVSLGLRGEYNIQKIEALSNLGEPIRVKNPVFSPLPFMNTAYNFSDRSLMRVAYSRTVNRPEFRELAPFLYYQFEYEAGLYGNPSLKTASINNIDVRYEFYPDRGEMITIGSFVKQFTNPIETYLQITTETPQLYFGNAASAYSYGLEVEVKKSLASFGLSRFIRNTSINFNGALIRSQVDIGNQATNQIKERPLQGQSPYVANLGIYYNDQQSGWSVNTAYNVFGPRIFSVGDKVFPSWWELPRQSMDLQIAKRFSRNKLEAKLNIQNLLNAPYRIFQDNNNDNKIGPQEALIQRYQVGTLFSVGLNWRVSGN